MNKKVLGILCVFILLIAASVYVYMTYEGKATNAPVQNQTTDKYKVYSDENNHYSVSYPEHWLMNPSQNESGIIIKIDNSASGEISIYKAKPGFTLGTGIDGIPDKEVSDFTSDSGKKGRRFDFLFQGNKEVQIYFESIFVISVIDSPQDYEKNKAQIEKILKSFNYTLEKREPQEVTVDKSLRQKLNIFFSNFSEAALPAFEKDKLPNSAMIQFGIRHNLINNFNLVEKYDSYNGVNGRINPEYVEKAVYKYFGKNITKHETVEAYKEISNGAHGDTGYFIFKDGFYLIPDNKNYQIDPARFPNGETAKFSQISKLYDSGNDYYIAYVDIYSVYPDQFQGDYYNGTPEEWKKQNQSRDVPTIVSKMKATIKREADGRYILIDYTEKT